MNSTVLVLNADHSLLNIVNWKRAYALVTNGKAEIVELSEAAVSNFDGTFSFVIPKIIRLVSFIHSVYKGKVAFSKRNVMIRDGFKCGYCTSTENLTIDHIVPVSTGGKNTWENCVCCCFACNKKKSNKQLKDTGMRLLVRTYQPTVSQFVQLKVNCLSIEKIFKRIARLG